jgi:formylmethanofuran dehydrogenase subunit B
MKSATPLTLHETKKSSHLKSITHNIPQCPVILQDIHELQTVSLANLIIRRVMCGCDFDGTCPKGHVNGEGICDDGQTAGDEGMFRKLSVKMLLIVMKMGRF